MAHYLDALTRQLDLLLEAHEEIETYRGLS